MIRKQLYTILLIISFIWMLFPFQVRAEDTLEQLRIANALVNEASWTGNSKDSLGKLAELLRNQYQEQRSKPGNSNITYSDILFHEKKPGEGNAFKNAREKLADKDKKTLEQMGQRANQDDWKEALSLAKQLTGNTLNTNFLNGANTYDKGNFYKENNVPTINHVYDSNVATKTSSNSNTQTAKSSTKSNDPTTGEDGNLTRDAAACTMESMQQIYLQSGDSDQYCWYCKIVVVLVNAYLKLAAETMENATIPLGKIILKWGFLIWLAYYILQQVSSLNPVTPGKMMQEILVMMFKVALAYAAINAGMTLIRDYYLNPIVGTGVDYGMAIYEKMKPASGG